MPSPEDRELIQAALAQGKPWRGDLLGIYSGPAEPAEIRARRHDQSTGLTDPSTFAKQNVLSRRLSD